MPNENGFESELYFLAAASDKRMRLLTSLYGILGSRCVVVQTVCDYFCIVQIY